MRAVEALQLERVAEVPDGANLGILHAQELAHRTNPTEVGEAEADDVRVLRIGCAEADLRPCANFDRGALQLLTKQGRAKGREGRGEHRAHEADGDGPTRQSFPASAADVDRDGDTDLLLCRTGNANLLRNDGGTLVRFAAVAPTGVLVDRDRDGFPDVFTGLRTYHNLHDHLWIPRPAALGIDWRIRVEAWREGPAVQYAILAIGAPYSAVVDMPGLGTVKMDLGTAALGMLPMVAGSGEVSIPIPTSPLLLGLQVGIQAAIADPLGWTLTDLAVDRIQ